MDLYDKPIEFKIWRARKITDPQVYVETRPITAGNVKPKTPNDSELDAAALAREMTMANLEKRSVLLEDYHKRVAQVELANDGRKTPPQPHHFDAAEKMVRVRFPEDNNELIKETADFQLKDSTSNGDLLKKSDSDELTPKVPPHPHHFDDPLKHITLVSDTEESDYEDPQQQFLRNMVIPPKTPPSPHHSQSADKTIFPSGSRPTSSSTRSSTSRPHSSGNRDPSSNVETSRPTSAKLAMAPHHFDSVERTIKPFQDATIPRIARTGKIPEEYYVVGTMTVDPSLLFFGDRSVVGR